MKLFLKFLSGLVFSWPVRIWLALIAAAAAPTIALILLMSIFLLPLAIPIMVVPAAAYLYAFHELVFQIGVRRVLPGKKGRAASAAIIIAASVVIAQVVNASHASRAHAHVAGDKSALTAAHIENIALVGVIRRKQRDEYRCSGLCLRLLLNNSVRQVVIADGSSLANDIPAIVAEFRQGGTCDGASVADLDDDRAAGQSGDRKVSAAELARLRIAGGDCLVEREGRLGEADAAVLQQHDLGSGKSSSTAARDPFADTLFAARLSFHRRRGDVWTEEYRKTAVRWRTFPAAIIPWPHFNQMNPVLGFVGSKSNINAPDYQTWQPRASDFVRDALGLPTALEPGLAPERRAVVDRAIAGEAVSAAVIDDFFDEFAHVRTPERADAERALAILRDGKIPFPSSSPNAVSPSGRAYPDLAAPFGDALFARYFATSPDARASRYNDPALPIIARTIAVLPEGELRQRMDEIRAALHDEVRGPFATPLVSKLMLGGDAAATDIFDSLDAALAAHRRDERDERWHDNYHAALAGLREIVTPSIAEALLGRLRREPEIRRYQRHLLIEILVKGGVSATTTRDLFAEDANEYELRAIDQDIANALRHKRR